MNVSEKVVYQKTDRGLIPIYADNIVDQPETYSEEDHETWSMLVKRQRESVKGRAHPLFLQCLEHMNFSERIPRFVDLEKKLNGWEVVAVNGLVSDSVFFGLLADKKFPTTWWIRPRAQFEYIQEPDLFHDIFGHVPFLMHEEYSSLVQMFGRIGSDPPSNDPEFMIKLARLYWFTIEFGIIGDGKKNWAAGAGLLSSPGEILYSLEQSTPKKHFSFKSASKTDYKIDSYQPFYFSFSSFDEAKKELLAFVEHEKTR